MKTANDRSALNQAKQHLREYLVSQGLDPSKNMKCLHHQPDNHPSMNLLPDGTAVYCHSCGWHADIVNVIAQVEGLLPNSKEAIDRAIEFAGTSPIKTPKPSSKSSKNITTQKHKWTPALKSKPCVDYLHSRGFSGDDKDILTKYNVSFDKKINCLIIPHDADYYTTRAIGNVSKDARFIHNPATSVTLFNSSAIDDEPIIAVCEGAIDALSLICCGMPAVATGGAQTQSKFINALKKAQSVPNIIIAFDADKSGVQAADKLSDKISETFHSPQVRLNLQGASDVNELFCKDRGKLQQAIKDAVDALQSGTITQPATPTIEEDNILQPEQIQQMLILNRFGFPVKSTTNFDAIFQHDPLAHSIVAFNELTNRIELTRRPPWRNSFQPGTPWQDFDDNALQNYIDRTYDLSANTVFLRVINEYAYRHSFHPIKNFFNSLPAWDGTPRVDTLLIDNLGAEDSFYIRNITRQWLLAAVARVFHPGCKFDYCLVLKGKQGIGKSTLLSLLGGKWFGELNNIQGKDAVGDLQGLWIVELTEMQATKKADNEQIKSFLSARIDRARLSYDRRTSEFPRQCVFAATTNDAEPLKDQTGGRRFWIAELHADHFSIRSDFNFEQVWAEVMHIYNTTFANGFDASKLDLGNALKPVAAELQAKNTDGSDIRGRIEAFLERPIPIKELWQLLSQEERRCYFKFGKFRLPFARIELEPQLSKHALYDLWRKIAKDDIDGEKFILLSNDISNDNIRFSIFNNDPRRHLISPVELANELFYDDKLPVSNRRIAEIMRTISGWQQSDRRIRDHAYGIQRTMFERTSES